MAKNRSARIVLVNPPPPHGAFVHYQNPLIGLAYMAAVLEKNGYEVAVVDCPPLNMTYEELRQEIGKLKPEIVGITSVTVTFSSALHAAEMIKKSYPETLIVLGGPHVTVTDEQTLKDYPAVDVVVRGEGEQTILELAEYASKSNHTKLSRVSGITFRKDGEIIQTPNRPFIQNLEQLPYPNYDYFPLERYRRFGKLILPVISSRGCPFRCTFCLAPWMAGNKFRARSPKDVVDELEWLKNKYEPDAITFHDETFTFDKKRVFRICKEIKDRDFNLPWDCSTRVDRISRELLAEMKGANCQLVSFGVESGSQRILDAMKKGTTVKQNERAVRWAKEIGISTTISVIIGYPGETSDTLEETLDFIKRTKPDSALISLATPYPGIELYTLIKDLGWKTCEEWSRCDMQTLVVENPSLPVDLKEVRRRFYDDFYSLSYILRQWLKGTFYSKNMARTALNHFLGRARLLGWFPTRARAHFRKLTPQRSKTISN
jgi:radical SAM superfamily enzyme YgiQ (UPF0313 family)